MLENCRVCCETTKGINAKNLFESKQRVLLYHIELLTGEWLTNEKDAPIYICKCCEHDLKVAAALRERCIKTQRILRNMNICASPTLGSIDKIKLEGTLVDENEHNETDQCVGASDYFALDCIGNEQVDDIKDSVNDVGDFDDFIITSSNIKEEEFQSIEDANNLEEQRVAEKLKISSPKQPMDSPDRTPVQIPPPIKRKKYINWRVLTEEQAKEMKRLKRRRDCVCEQCGRHFNDPSNLKRHLLRHAGIKNYECDVCNAKFYTVYLLKRHSLMHMSNPPTFACKYCDKTFIYNNLRLTHERSHFMDRRFKCQFCVKSFFNKSLRRKHELVHTQTRKYYCETCDQYFLLVSHLKVHYRSKTHKNMEQQRK